MDIARELEQVVRDLAERYPRYPLSALEGLVQRTSEPFRHARITTYVPILVRRAALAQVRYVQEGFAQDDPPVKAAARRPTRQPSG